MSSGGVRFTDGFDRPDTIAFGLDAPRLVTVVACALCAYGVMQAPVPFALRVVAALLLASCGAVLGWGRYAGRPLLSWAWLALRFALSPRSGGGVVVAAAVAGDVAEPVAAATVPTPAVVPAPVADRPDVPEWARWLDFEVEQDGGGEAEVPAAEAVDGSVDIVRDAPVVVVMDEHTDDVGGEALGRDADPAVPAAVATHVSGAVERAHEEAACADDEVEGEVEPEEDPDLPQVLRLPVAPPDVVAHDVVADGASATAGAAPVFVGAPRRVTFFSLNGGSGRTTLTTEVAAVLAARGHHLAPDGTVRRLHVALLDLDMRSATVAVRLGIAHPTLADYLLQGGEPAQLDGCMVRHRSGLRALLGPPKPLPPETVARETARVAEIVHRLERDGAQFVLIDTGSDLDAVTTWVLSSVHDIFVVITPTASGVQDAYRTTEALRRLGLGHKLRYVVNRARENPDLDEVMGDLGGRIAAVIPYDPAVEDSENNHRITALEAEGPAAAALHDLAALLYPSLGATERRARLGWLPWRRRAG